MIGGNFLFWVSFFVWVSLSEARLVSEKTEETEKGCIWNLEAVDFFIDFLSSSSSFFFFFQLVLFLWGV